MDDKQENTFEKVKGKSKRGLVRIIFGRSVLFFVFILLQLAVLYAIYRFLDKQYQIYGFALSTIVGAVLAVIILNEKKNASFKMSWLVLVLIFPVFGGLFYTFVHLQVDSKWIAIRIRDVRSRTSHYMKQDQAVLEEIKEKGGCGYGVCNYLSNTCGFKVYGATNLKYYPLGDDFYAELIPELEAAESFIFLEYFIITPGIMWDSLLEILKKKAKAGVDVRLLYDGMNSFSSLPYNYPQQLEAEGIKCRIFNPIRPVISTVQNNRDHRKILVIDGRTAYTGGVNLADEYINRKVRFGHWKDNAIRVKGEAVDSFTVMFLQMWEVCAPKQEFEFNYDRFIGRGADVIPDLEKSGFAVPFCDSPLDSEAIGHHVYLDLAYQAKKSLYIMTPYLVLDDDMLTALSYAAKRGVDVTIIMPHIPDKKYAFMLAHTYYPELIETGVKIYEYLPGFVHSKVVLCDDTQAVVGSINLDFRSQYLNFESAVYFCGNPVLSAIRKDFEETLEKCVLMTLDSVRLLPFYHRFIGSALRIVAPLM